MSSQITPLSSRRYAPRSSQFSDDESLPTGILERMAAAWRDGQPLAAERLLSEFPELATQANLAVRVIFEEVCLREELGQTVEDEELFRRFPQWRDELEVVLDCHRLLGQDPPAPQFPEVGQRLGELELIRELGRGAAGRVFLASQPSLSERLLVVKLTARTGSEHLSLARLQHTHIAPLYLIQEFPQENLRALCMPYLGGASWSAVLDALRSQPFERRSGRQIADCIASPGGAPALNTSPGPAWHFLARCSYVDAVVWITSCLADALHYAHQRGLLHLDVKPSNVLLAGDGQPMLLDFHLAHEATFAAAGTLDRLGGTRGYMSPEQQSIAAAIRVGGAAEGTLDGRSDVYSLGVLLYESLTGSLPPTDEAESRRLLRRTNPDAGCGLSDIVHKCLSRQRAARYDDAGQLAVDLRRHLAAMPLAGVPNRSLRERWQKWRRRKPHALALVAVAATTLVVVSALGILVYGERTRQARAALQQAERQLVARDYSGAIEQLNAGRNAIAWLPNKAELKRTFQARIEAAELARLTDSVHVLAEKLRFIDSVEEVPRERLQQLAAGCGRIWEARERIIRRDGLPTSTEASAQLDADLLELAVLWARLKVRLMSEPEKLPAQSEALGVLEEARSLWGDSLTLCLAREELGPPTGRASAASGAVPSTLWEHYVLARHRYRAGQMEEAQAGFERAVQLEPGAFWPNWYLTLTRYRQGQFALALQSACVCVALEPNSAECFHNRALCHTALEEHEAALDDFAAAIGLDPNLAASWLHRAVVLIRQERHDDALVDLNRALTLGANPAETRYQIALAHWGNRDRAAAIESLEHALQHSPGDSPAASLYRQLAQPE